MTENQVEQLIESQNEQSEEQPFIEVVKRGRGRPRKGCEVPRESNEDENQPRVNKTDNPAYFREYYHRKIKPLKNIEQKIRTEIRTQEIEKARELLSMSADEVVTQIKSLRETPKISIEKMNDLMIAICKKLEIEL